MWLATGYTDMRKGPDGLALWMQEKLKRDPHRVIFRLSRSARLADQNAMARGRGMCLYAKRLERESSERLELPRAIMR